MVHASEAGLIVMNLPILRVHNHQGKHPINAINDPDLNLQFLACEVLWPNFATTFWKEC